MTERPILFTGDMVRAILAGTKTQTRRVVKHIPTVGGPERWCSKAGDAEFARIVGDYRRFCPYGEPGDLLWVRETWAAHWRHDGVAPSKMERRVARGLWYRAGGSTGLHGERGRWRPSIHMPRWASRITLRVTDVRVRRVQSISEEDARAEGVRPPEHQTARGAFADLWDSINAKRGFGWREDPWVWVVEFERVGAE